eukprot:GHVQ01002032.1.p2 GENE.GHVQ01002032.1~~GHVQ01002032.1.p2  ORF type:complete len:111 (+),score=13.97 GHVQ01002032.1:1-333(+)
MLASAQGKPTEDEDISMGVVEEVFSDKLRQVMDGYRPEAVAMRNRLFQKGVRGVPVANLRREWYKMLKAPLQPLLTRAGYANVCEVVADVPDIRVTGTVYRDLRCLVYIE